MSQKQSSRNDYDVDVCIMGGGIAGLAAAHDLVTDGQFGPGKRILIVEQNSVVGGQARSGLTADGLPVEYCSRIYGPGYATVRRMMKQIPLVGEAEDGRACVHDNLVDTTDFLVARNTSSTAEVPGSFRLNYSLSAWRDYRAGLRDVRPATWYKLLNKFAYALTSSNARLEGQLSEVTWADFLDLKAPDERVARLYAVDALGPYLGVDLYKASAQANWSIVEEAISNPAQGGGGGKMGRGSVSVLNGPTNHAWFRHWTAHLQKSGVVRIVHHVRVQRVEMDASGTKVEAVYLEHVDGTGLSARLSTALRQLWPFSSGGFQVNNQGSVRVRARHYVSALPPEVLARFVQEDPTRDLALVPTFQKMPRLAALGHQQMVGCVLFWDEPLTFPHGRTWIHLAESPWQLVIEPQHELWSEDENNRWRTAAMRSSVASDRRIKGIWSLGLCDDRALGITIKKPWVDCTRLEMAREIHAQILSARGLDEQIYVPAQPEKRLKDVRLLRCHLWDSYQPAGAVEPQTSRGDSKHPYLRTREPKFSPNAGTYALRPDVDVPGVRNLYVCGSWVRNTEAMVLMDAAAETGAAAAARILRDSGLRNLQTPTRRPPRPCSIVLAPLRLLDAILYALGLPHASAIVGGGQSVVLLLVYIVGLLWVLWRVLQRGMH